MSRLDLSPSVRGYLERHAVDLDLAYELGVRSDRDTILYPYSTPLGATVMPVAATSTTSAGSRSSRQGEPLILWWPAGRPDPGAGSCSCEGEPDALAALSALNGGRTPSRLSPAMTIPPERVTAELAPPASRLSGDGRRRRRTQGRQPDRPRAARLHRAAGLRVGDGEDLASRLYREDDREDWIRTALDKAKPRAEGEAEVRGQRLPTQDGGPHPRPPRAGHRPGPDRPRGAARRRPRLHPRLVVLPVVVKDEDQ